METLLEQRALGRDEREFLEKISVLIENPKFLSLQNVARGISALLEISSIEQLMPCLNQYYPPVLYIIENSLESWLL